MILLPDLQATQDFGQALGRVLAVGDVVALSGDLGAGKTTLARGILQGCGFAGEVTSPTFPIVQVYDGAEMRIPAWHVDLYRIEDPEEIAELALDDAVEEGALLIEWPERMAGGLWHKSLHLRLQEAGPAARALTATVPEAWEERWPPL